MQKRFINYGSIKQFRNVINDIKHLAKYVGYDEKNKEPIYDNTKTLPKIMAIGTEKIHGCLRHDTLVTTKEYGDITIGSIIDENLDCHVLTFNFKTNKNEWNKILNKWTKEDDSKDWYELIIDEGHTLVLTGNHKVWCCNKNTYIRCDELTIDDIVQIR